MPRKPKPRKPYLESGLYAIDPNGALWKQGPEEFTWVKVDGSTNR